jgi:hypothetical protein
MEITFQTLCQSTRCVCLLFLGILSMCVGANAQDVQQEMANSGGEDIQQVVAVNEARTAHANVLPEQPEKPAHLSLGKLPGILRFGMESYFGFTNITGVHRRSTDGLWAGNSGAYPSTLSLNWHSGETRAFRIAIGIGDMYLGRNTPLHQPVEAYYQFPAGKHYHITLGKFYTPFAAQEWQYESKYGVMMNSTIKGVNYSLALQYDEVTKKPNAYLRLGRQLNARTTAGLSFGVGKGLTYGTSHTWGFAIDLAHDLGFADFNTECDFCGASSGLFQFLFGKLTLKNLGNWSPYLAAYYWHDTARELGNFHSAVVGIDFHISSYLTLGAAYARANSRDVFWVQKRTSF